MMKNLADNQKTRGPYWGAWIRTICYRFAFYSFGFMRWVRSKIARKSSKRWHGPLWKKIGAILFGTTTRLSIDKNGNFFYIRPHQINDLILLFGRPEERIVDETIQLLNSGDIFVDVGAYIGQYTVLAADKVGQSGIVVAIEPENQNFTLLQRNIEVNDIYNAYLHNIALGRKDGTASLLSTTEDLAVSTMKSSWISALYPELCKDKKVTFTEVKTITTIMKEARLDHIDLLKLDVEGAEVEVLHGGSEQLKTGNIHCIVCELHRTGSEVKTLLERYGYQVKRYPQHIVAYLSHGPEIIR